MARICLLVLVVATLAAAGAEFDVQAQLPGSTPDLAARAFDQLWTAFDRDYPKFILRPEVNWREQYDRYRARALACRSTNQFAALCGRMLRPLRDLHVWLSLAGKPVPTYWRPRSPNWNPNAHHGILGEIKGTQPLEWAITADHLGYIRIRNFDPAAKICGGFYMILERMRETDGLIIDVRWNDGGGDPEAEGVAGRFLHDKFVYAFHQFRTGTNHTDLSAKQARTVTPREWIYARPVVLLTGQMCISAGETFVSMMSGATNVTTMGDRTCGSSGNTQTIRLPLELSVGVPAWIDYLPNGQPLDDQGVQPQVVFEPVVGTFEGNRDELLSAALERLRKAKDEKRPHAQPSPSVDASRG